MGAHSRTEDADLMEAFQRGDTLITTGTLTRIVEGDVADVWDVEAYYGDSLDALDWSPENDPTGLGYLEELPREGRSTAVVDGPNTRRYPSGQVRHRHRESFIMAWLVLTLAPVRLVGCAVRGLGRAIRRGFWNAYLTGMDHLGVPLDTDWQQRTTARVKSIPRLVWTRCLRIVARYRVASHTNTEWGLAMLRRLATIWGKRIFFVAITLLVVSFFAITFGIVNGGLRPNHITGGVLLIGGLFALAYFVDLIGETADTERFDLIVARLPDTLRQRAGELYWATMTPAHTYRATARVGRPHHQEQLHDPA